MGKTHHWRWRSPRYLILCGTKDGLINRRDPSDITCLKCLKKMKKLGPDWQRMTPPDKESE